MVPQIHRDRFTGIAREALLERKDPPRRGDGYGNLSSLGEVANRTLIEGVEGDLQAALEKHRVWVEAHDKLHEEHYARFVREHAESYRWELSRMGADILKMEGRFVSMVKVLGIVGVFYLGLVVFLLVRL